MPPPPGLDEPKLQECYLGVAGRRAAHLRGADLERRIERFLVLHGYACRRNAVLEGRSGGRHEVDVLAEKRDGVTSYRLAVECKAWNHPVDKEVVAKLAFVVNDLGLHKGIVVSVGGSTLGAEQSARELGVELWGPDDLTPRLGQAALAEVTAGPAPRLAGGVPVRCRVETAQRLIADERRGWYGKRRERTESIDLAWVPHHVLTIATTEPDLGFRRRGAVKASWRWNLYEGVTGSFIRTLPEEQQLVECDLTVTLIAAVPVGKLVDTIRRVAQRRHDVVSPSARDRYAAQLEHFGIPGDALSVGIEETGLLYWPFHLGLLTSGTGARVVAVDAHRSALSPPMGELLTGALGHVRRALRPPTVLGVRAGPDL